MFVRRGAVTRVQLLPIFMDVQKDGLPIFPADADARTINTALRELSRPFNTTIRTEGWYTEVRPVTAGTTVLPGMAAAANLPA